MPTEKTVYILGAGFSIPAGIPAQGELLSVISNYRLLAPLTRTRTQLFKFIEDVFGLDREQAKSLELEDIYTPLHQSISRNEYLKSYSPEALKKVENALNRLVAHVIDNGKSGHLEDTGYVEEFAYHLLAAKHQWPRADRFSVISLNWDILLDKRLFSSIGDNEVIDYGCHCTGIDSGNQMVPAMAATERGLIVQKLLKPHGSLNWVTCPKCQRVFVHKNEKAGIKAFKGTAECRFCDSVKLNAALLLPTFQKDMAKFHFQHIWNQCSRELAKATKLVFIGYSFPLADFDFRSLITKHVGDVEVEVVLYSPDGLENAEGKRYKDYFGDKITNINYGGVVDFIPTLTPTY
jgi:NAD-dependent SIR2 family protein deacetylase